MHALASSPGLSEAPAAARRPRLRTVPPPRPRAASVAIYAVGLTAGFLLAAVASVPGGLAVAGGQLALAGVCAAVAGLALARSRTVVRARNRR